MSDLRPNNGSKTLVVRVPIQFQKRGGRKLILGAGASTPLARSTKAANVDATLVKALARAHRWKRMLESGEYSSIGDLARSEQINYSYVRRLLRLTLLSPAITESVLNGTCSEQFSLATVSEPFPIEWDRQAKALFSVV